jgi:predicted DNA-binding helix-hairpin-helix protein
MIVGATKESDYHIINVAEALYKNYDLKRVFYSAYIPINDDSALPALDAKPPLLREHRLYQADWLLRFYGFKASELLTKERPFFNENIDPKCDWAVRNLEHFPVEINKADMAMLLRVPGIGVKSARRIVQARRFGVIDFADLKKMGVVLKRALYFITCKGKMMYDTKLEESYIVNHLIYNEPPHKVLGQGKGNYYQMSLFDFENKIFGNDDALDKNVISDSGHTMLNKLVAGGGV